MELTPTEKRVLQSIHLQGHTGKMGSMNLQKRRELLQGLIEKDLLDKNGKVTELGIELTAPKF